MKLSSLLESSNIRFVTMTKNKVTKSFTEPFMNNRLYKEGRTLEWWWKDPNYFLPKGAHFSIMYDGDVPVGIAICSRRQPKQIEQLTATKNLGSGEFELIGAISIYIVPKYRKQGHARTLLMNLENEILKGWNRQSIPTASVSSFKYNFYASVLKKIGLITQG